MNIWLFYGIIFFASITIILWGLYKEYQFAAALIAVPTLFFTRAMQVLNPYREFGDSYHYWKAPMAILQNGGLTGPEVLQRVPGVENFLSFPLMHVTTAAIVQITGIEDMGLARALIPSFFAVSGFLILVALASHVLGRQWSVIAAYTIVQLDSVIFYQTEYHAQSFGFIFIAFTLLVVLRYLHSSNPRNTALLVLAVIGLGLAHRFSSVYGFLLFLLATIAFLIYDLLPRSNFDKRIVDRVSSATLLIGVVVISIHIFINSFVIEQSLGRSVMILQGHELGFTPPSSPSSGNGGESILDRFSIIFKVALTIAAVPVVVLSFLRDYREKEMFMLAFLGAVGVSAIPVFALSYPVLTRVFLISFIPLTIIAFLSFQKYVPVETVKPIAGAFAITIIVLGVMSGVTPSLIDPGSDIRADGFHEVEPMAGEHEEAGRWLRAHAAYDETAVTAETYHVAATFGQLSSGKAVYIGVADEPRPYTIVDQARHEQPAPNLVYDNGRISVGYTKSTYPPRSRTAARASTRMPAAKVGSQEPTK